MVIKNMIPVALATKAVATIKHKIAELAQLLGVSTTDYLNCTGRWDGASLVTKMVSMLDRIIHNYLKRLGQYSILQIKSNVICKTVDLTDAVPFHQDIAYSFKVPYHFSVWLALNDVPATSGALQIIQGSHHWPIEPLVDFWQPYYRDKYADGSSHPIETLPILAGDAIVFDSKLWHGSAKSLDAQDRFAYVTRWTIPKQSFPNIPKPRVSNFGILNCGVQTETILRKYLESLDLYPNTVHPNRTELIKIWLNLLTHPSPIAQVNAIQAKEDLYKLLILDQASALHGAGDISGKVYKNVWFSLLKVLNQKVQVVV